MLAARRPSPPKSPQHSSGARSRACANISSTRGCGSLKSAGSTSGGHSRARGARGFEGAAERNERAEVVGVVVCDEQRLAQKALARAVRNLRVKVVGLVFDQSLHRTQVCLEALDAAAPVILVGRNV